MSTTTLGIFDKVEGSCGRSSGPVDQRDGETFVVLYLRARFMTPGWSAVDGRAASRYPEAIAA